MSPAETIAASRPPDEVRFGEWEPDGEPYDAGIVNLAEGLYSLWPVFIPARNTKQDWHRRRMERWYEGGQIIGRWTWEPLKP